MLRFLDSDALDRVFPLPACDPENPNAIDPAKDPPYLRLPLGSADTVTALRGWGITPDLVPEGDASYHAIDMIHPSAKASAAIGGRVAAVIRQ